MKPAIILFAFLFTSQSLIAQINKEDSSAQVIGYWSKGDKQTYTIVQDEYKVKGTDTTDRLICRYSVDVVVKDSTKDSYTIDWTYSDFKIESESELARRVGSLAQNLTLLIRTNEFGEFQEVMNWKEAKVYMNKMLGDLKKEYKDNKVVDLMAKQLESQYESKESFEQGAINEIHQFFAYHGEKFEYGEEYHSKMQLANLFGGKPFDADVVVWMDEMDFDEDNYVLRMTREVDSEQLTDATYEYLKKLTEDLDADLPKRKDFPDLINKTWVAARMHDSGWPIYSIETKEVSSESVIKVEEISIELQ